MAGKTRQQPTFGVRLPDLKQGTSLPELGGLVDVICSAMAAMAACPPEKLRVAKISMNSPLEIQFQGDQKTVALVQARIVNLTTRAAAVLHGSEEPVDQFRGELAEELGKLARKAGGSIALRTGSGKWRRLGRQQLKKIALSRTRQEILRSYRTSLTGVLEQVTVEGEKQRFRIRETSTGRNIQCDFPLDMLEHVKEALPHRVCVSGTLNCRTGGEAESMEADDFEILPDEDDVPLTELQPLHITGGADAADLIARLRDGE